MTFEHYLAPSAWDIISHALFGALIGGSFLLIWFGITMVTFRSKVEKKVTLQCTALFAGLGLLFGSASGLNVKNNDNDRILQTNVSKKYDAVITDMGIRPQSRGSHYSPTYKEAHEVKILVAEKEQLAILIQDETTNEPTFLDFNTKEPLTNFFKN